jgi:hypothetical protein
MICLYSLLYQEKKNPLGLQVLYKYYAWYGAQSYNMN